MKYAEMTPREIDKLVQVTLMGGLQCDGKVVRIAESDGWECLKCGAWSDDAPKHHEMPAHRIPAYSTDIAASMSVLEKFERSDLAKLGNAHKQSQGGQSRWQTRMARCHNPNTMTM